jgi:antitoxin component YwqK of YwqJK toxin-antitoxin module
MRKRMTKKSKIISLLLSFMALSISVKSQRMFKISILDSNLFETKTYGHELSIELKKDILVDGMYFVFHPLDSTKPIILCSIKNYEYFGYYSENYVYESCKKSQFYNENGALEGIAMQWHTNGNLMLISSYKNGVLDGNYIEWYPNGVKYIEAKYKDGNLDGTVTTWNIDGSIKTKITYVKGQIINSE